MDPLTVATACVGTIAGITQLVSEIKSFIRDFKDARDDMRAVWAQLKAVKHSLEQLQRESTKVNYPADLSRRFIDMVRNCDKVVKAMTQVLDEVSNSKSSRRLQWTLTGESQIVKLSSRLESYKTAVGVAVGVASLCLTVEIKNDTSQILRETAALHQQMGLMQLQMTSLQQSSSTDSVIMQRFMDETTSYAESVLEDQQFVSAALQSAAGGAKAVSAPTAVPALDTTADSIRDARLNELRASIVFMSENPQLLQLSNVELQSLYVDSAIKALVGADEESRKTAFKYLEIYSIIRLMQANEGRDIKGLLYRGDQLATRKFQQIFTYKKDQCEAKAARKKRSREEAMPKSSGRPSEVERLIKFFDSRKRLRDQDSVRGDG